MPDQRDALAEIYFERNVLEHPIVALVREPDVLELDLASNIAVLHQRLPHPSRRHECRISRFHVCSPSRKAKAVPSRGSERPTRITIGGDSGFLSIVGRIDALDPPRPSARSPLAAPLAPPLRQSLDATSDGAAPAPTPPCRRVDTRDPSVYKLPASREDGGTGRRTSLRC